MLSPAEQEHRDFVYATPGDWDREEARELGQLHPERPWILTDRDVWHKNSSYTGPPVPHPEDECWERMGEEPPSCDCPETPACHQELCDECRAAFEADMRRQHLLDAPDPPF